MEVELIYCADGNKRFAEIAIEAGFLYGAQVPNTVYHPPYFCDQDWRKPDREGYMSALAEHKPHVTTVLDWEHPDQLSEVLGWAEDAAQFADVVVIIPKVIGGIQDLPRTIGGKDIRLGYSVPTKFGGTQVPAWEFTGWPVHLLGGNPHHQMKLARYLNAVSTDGNMALLMATRHCAFWDPAKTTKKYYWPTIELYDGSKWGNGSAKADAPYEAFRRSCQNIMAAWRNQ